MHLGKVQSVQTDLATSHMIDVEVDINKSGLPSFSIVGLPSKAVEESKERVCSAIRNSGYDNPKKYKTVVSLSPADVKKEGPHFDLPIALSIMLADQDQALDYNPEGMCFVGELALDGEVRPIKGVLALAQHAYESGCHSLYVPAFNAEEAALVKGIKVYSVTSLQQLVLHLNEQNKTPKQESLIIQPHPPTEYSSVPADPAVDMSDIVDQDHVKRALIIAAAGGHNIAMYGPAGTGKTMLAKAFTGILPPLSHDQMLESTAIHSYVGSLEGTHLCSAPYRAPHHTSSYASVIGGGTYPRPGEISLAHNGVLFMDEFPEFDKRVLESLREPMEDHEVRISRSRGSVTFPARFMLLAALNPPSAVYREKSAVTPADIRRFNRKISGPIMDRIDIWVEVPKVKHSKLMEKTRSGASSRELQKQVVSARDVQYRRFSAHQTNSSMSVQDIEKHIHLNQQTKNLLDTSASKLNLSPRVYHKILKLARTIADLERRGDIQESHILEALQYRPRDII